MWPSSNWAVYATLWYGYSTAHGSSHAAPKQQPCRKHPIRPNASPIITHGAPMSIACRSGILL